MNLCCLYGKYDWSGWVGGMKYFSGAVNGWVCVIGSVEDIDWRESLFKLPPPWHCDELMPSLEDMHALMDIEDTVSSFFNF